MSCDRQSRSTEKASAPPIRRSVSTEGAPIDLPRLGERKGLWSRFRTWIVAQPSSEVKGRRPAGYHLPQEQDFKILVLGHKGVGKSVVIQRLMGLRPSSTIPTIGCEVSTRPIPRDFLPLPFHSDICVRFVEVAYPEIRGRNLKRILNSVDGAIIVFDVTDRISMQAVDEWRRILSGSMFDTVPVFLVANKCDLKKKGITFAALENYAKICKFHSWWMISALKGAHINELTYLLLQMTLAFHLKKTKLASQTKVESKEDEKIQKEVNADEQITIFIRDFNELYASARLAYNELRTTFDHCLSSPCSRRNAEVSMMKIQCISEEAIIFEKLNNLKKRMAGDSFIVSKLQSDSVLPTNPALADLYSADSFSPSSPVPSQTALIKEASSSTPTKEKPAARRTFPATRSLPFVLGLVPEFSSIHRQFHTDAAQWRHLKISLDTEIHVIGQAESTASLEPEARTQLSQSDLISPRAPSVMDESAFDPPSPTKTHEASHHVKKTPPIDITKRDERYKALAEDDLHPVRSSQVSDLSIPEGVVAAFEVISSYSGNIAPKKDVHSYSSSFGEHNITPNSHSHSRNSFSGKKQLGFEFRKAGRNLRVNAPNTANTTTTASAEASPSIARANDESKDETAADDEPQFVLSPLVQRPAD